MSPIRSIAGYSPMASGLPPVLAELDPKGRHRPLA
jgi:hypothetical protein